MTDKLKGDETTITLQDTLAGAFQALLRGDTGERDKLCALAERTFQAHGNIDLAGDTTIIMGKEGSQ